MGCTLKAGESFEDGFRGDLNHRSSNPPAGVKIGVRSMAFGLVFSLKPSKTGQGCILLRL